jgi:hypothetical protein
MGIPLIDGRMFDARDAADAPPVLIVSETFAREYFPGERAVGKRVAFYASRAGAAPPPDREIVGIVRDVRQDGVRTRPVPQMYAPYAQMPWGFVSFFVHAADGPVVGAALLQRAVSSVDAMRPIRDVKTTREIVLGSTARQRAMTVMLSVLAVIALTLATVGLYGVSATAATARSRELAIRAAIGAQPRSLLALVVTRGVSTGCLGVAAGTCVGLVATQGLGALLYETPPSDFLTFLATASLLVVIVLTATYLPARRALRANPAEVLRAE